MICCDEQIFCVENVIYFHIFSDPSILPYVLGAQKNRLNEAVLLSTHNICFGKEVRKLFFDYQPLSKGLIQVSFFTCSQGSIY